MASEPGPGLGEQVDMSHMRMIGAIGSGWMLCASALGAGETWVQVPYNAAESGVSVREILSADGRVVALADGVSFWSEADGRVELPGIGPSDDPGAFGIVAMSRDGSRVVFHTPGSYAGEYQVWTREAGFAPAEDVYPGLQSEDEYAIHGISGDGEWVVGVRIVQEMECGPEGPAMRWAVGGATDVLGTVGGFTGSIAACASHNGAVVAGGSSDRADACRTGAFFWTGADGLTEVDPPIGYLEGRLSEVSADGSTFGGSFVRQSDSSELAVVWAPGFGYRVLNFPVIVSGEPARGLVQSIGADGSFAFGHHRIGDDAYRFLWTERLGIDEAVWYVDQRIDHDPHPTDPGHTRWTASVRDVSDDGRTFLVDVIWNDEEGNGIDPGVYLLTLPLPCAGDANGDERVDVNDFTMVTAHFGQAVTRGSSGDLTRDGVVNAADFLVLASDFGCTAADVQRAKRRE